MNCTNIRSVQKQLDDLQQIIGNGSLNDTLISKINSLQNEIKEFKQQNQVQTVQQTETVKSQITTINKSLGETKLQTNSQDVFGAINELLSLIKQNISMNTILVSLNDISKTLFTIKDIKQQIEFFETQIQTQILNYNNVLTILSSSQEIIKDDKQSIRYGYQDGKLFIEKYSKESDVQDVRFSWDTQKGFYVNYDYCPIVIKCYVKNIFQRLSDDEINALNESLPSQFNGFIFGSLNSERNIVQYNQDVIQAKNIQIQGCEINGHVDLQHCILEGVKITTKYNKLNPSIFDQCQITESKIYVLPFKEQQHLDKVQLKFSACQMMDNIIESAYPIEINVDQYTQKQLNQMYNINNTYLIDRSLLLTNKQEFIWDLTSLSKIVFDKCDFIIRDEVQHNSHISVDNDNIVLQNCKLIISTEKYSDYIKQPVDKLSENSSIFIQSDLSNNDAIINQSTLSAQNVKFYVQGDKFKQYLVKSQIYSKDKHVIEGQGENMKEIDLVEVMC